MENGNGGTGGLSWLSHEILTITPLTVRPGTSILYLASLNKVHDTDPGWADGILLLAL